MATITLNILEERALDVIRYLEKVKDVEVIDGPATDEVKVEQVGATISRPQRSWYGALADSPNKDKMIDYFDNIRDEWEDRL